MLTLQPAHPVYARQEDHRTRDTMAESEAGVYFEKYLSQRCVLRTNSDGKLVQMLPEPENIVMDALRDLFVDGWNAAREAQSR